MPPSAELSDDRPVSRLLVCVVRVVICCCDAALRAFTSAVTIASTFKPDARPAELMVELPELLLDDVPLVELPLVLPDVPLPELVLVPSWLSRELRLLPLVLLPVVVIALPCQFPEVVP